MKPYLLLTPGPLTTSETVKNCFPVAGEFKIGDVVRVTGVTETYQGENELQVSSIEVVAAGVHPLEAVLAALDQLNGCLLYTSRCV